MSDVTYIIHDYAGQRGCDKTVTVDTKSAEGALVLFLLNKNDELPKRFDGLGITIVGVMEELNWDFGIGDNPFG